MVGSIDGGPHTKTGLTITAPAAFSAASDVSGFFNTATTYHGATVISSPFLC